MPTPKQYADALSATPRNSWKYLADAMQPVSEFADEFKVKENIPLVGGMSAADFTGLKGAYGLADDASYGKYPIRGASLQTAKVDPRVIDAMGLAGALMPVAKNVGKAALGEVARQIHTGTGIGRAALNPRMNMVEEGIPKFPQPDGELRSAIAQRNAALPISEGGLGLPANNTPMDRANAPGMYPIDAYHGTTTEIDPSFNLDYSGASAFNYGKKNIWASDNPELASQYAETGLSRNQAEAIQKLGDFNWTKKEEIPDKIADAMFKDIKEFGSIEGGGANVLPLRLGGKQSLYDAYGGRWNNEIPKALRERYLENADIAVINNVIDNPTLQKVDPSTVYAISNPANIRSRFAAFDPFRRHEADILAGVGIGGMLDPEAVSEEFRKKERK